MHIRPGGSTLKTGCSMCGKENFVSISRNILSINQIHSCLGYGDRKNLDEAGKNTSRFLNDAMPDHTDPADTVAVHRLQHDKENPPRFRGL